MRVTFNLYVLKIHAVFIRIEAPRQNFEGQHIISAADNSHNESAHEEDFERLMCHAHNPRHFCHPKVFAQDIDSMWQNAIVNKSQVEKNYLIYFRPKTGVASISEGASLLPS